MRNLSIKKLFLFQRIVQIFTKVYNQLQPEKRAIPRLLQKLLPYLLYNYQFVLFPFVLARFNIPQKIIELVKCSAKHNMHALLIL